MGVLCMLVLSVISKVLKVFVASQHVRKNSVHRWRGSEMVKTQDPVRWTHGLMDSWTPKIMMCCINLPMKFLRVVFEYPPWLPSTMGTCSSKGKTASQMFTANRFKQHIWRVVEKTATRRCRSLTSHFLGCLNTGRSPIIPEIP